MANEQIKLNTRIQQKHDVETNWLKATGFIPKEGEIIVYDIDSTHQYPRIKIGNGNDNVNDLPFMGASANWVQNDAAQFDYIKNRTHWIEGGETVPVQGVWSDSALFTCVQPINLEAGNTYVVTWDGIDYVSVATSYLHENLHLIALGNMPLYAGYGDTGEPFVIAEFTVDSEITQVGAYGIAGSMTRKNNVEFSIKKPVFRKLDAEFYDRIAWVEGGEVLPETFCQVENPIDFAGAFLYSPFQLINSESYNVVFDGEEYVCVATTSTDGLVGAVTLVSDGNTFAIAQLHTPLTTSEGKTIYGIAVPMEDSTYFTIRIYQNEIIHKIDPKFYDRLAWNEKSSKIDIQWNQDEGTESTGYIVNSIQLESGETYIVNWNNMDYEVVAKYFSASGLSATILGNPVDWGGEDNGLPFLIGAFPAELAAQMHVYGGVAGVNCVLDKNFTVYETITHKIDPKFYERLAWDDKKEILPETILQINGVDDIGANISVPLNLKVGETYSVIVNDVKYICTATTHESVNGVILSDGTVFDGENNFNFAIVEIAEPLEDTTTGGLCYGFAIGPTNPFTMRIYQGSIHKIDPKFIDEDHINSLIEARVQEGVLPEVTAADNGKALKVINGEWGVNNIDYNDLLNKPLPLIGTTEDTTPEQVALAVMEGRPVSITYVDATLGQMIGNNFAVNATLYAVVATDVIYYDSQYIAYELVGNIQNNTWTSLLLPIAKEEHTHDVSDVTTGTFSSDRLPIIPINKGGTGAADATNALKNLGLTATASDINKLKGVLATTAEFNYLQGVTSNIQTQLNSKISTADVITNAEIDEICGYAIDLYLNTIAAEGVSF